MIKLYNTVVLKNCSRIGEKRGKSVYALVCVYEKETEKRKVKERERRNYDID